MREILFRGKRIEDREWEYGDLWCNPYAKRVVCIVSPINDQSTTGGNSVDPETVGQYTGLNDKNGTKIFEGDIIRCTLKSEEVDVLAVVKYGLYIDVNSLWDYEYLGWYLTIKDKCISILSYENDGLEFEIIGNIHDNPELLEA
jgi:uncharacterized phage protein (TIGR01671 family)